MEYKTRGEYINALEAALEGKNIPDADKMVTDIRNYFFKFGIAINENVS